MFSVHVQREPFDLNDEAEALAAGQTDVGAVVTFTGLCRGEGETLAALELEHYPGMAEEEIGRVLAEARGRFSLEGATVIHRYGVMRPGDPIVLVATASRHRRDAFLAAAFLMDYLKTRAPFWKKEHRADGTSGGWVEAKDSDDRAADAWKG